jgi:preprotein translocase subunit SecF
MIPNVMKYRWWYLGFSGVLLFIAVFFLSWQKLRLAVDFTGGSLLEIKIEDQNLPSTSVLAEVVQPVFVTSSVQSSSDGSFVLRGKTIDNNQKDLALAVISSKYPNVTELRFESVGPTLGKELLVKALTAIGLVTVFITLYVWYKFHELRYGLAAILAMIHDSLIVLGTFSILGWWLGVEVDVLFVTALLTTLSFSVHDTIVVYDRIREKRKDFPRAPLETITNAAVIETFGRSINNSLTIIVMLLTLVLLGGETIRWFAVALLVGAITGTYSSPFVAAPLTLIWDEVVPKLQAKFRTTKR